MVNKETISHINTIIEAKNQNKLVVFAGAGISVESGAPSWSNLIKSFAEELSLDASKHDNLRIAQMYFNKFEAEKYAEKLRTELKYKQLLPNPLHEIIFDLEPLHIVTTNYDDLLEKVIDKDAHSYSVIKKNTDFPSAFNGKYLLKIHGDLDFPETIVLKEDDYIAYSSSHPLFETYMKSLFATNIILFVGYGYGDNNLKYILSNIRSILQDDFQPAYLLNVEEEYDQHNRDYFKHNGIEVINFHDFDYVEKDTKHNYIEQYLDGKNVFEYKHKKETFENPKSTKTYNLLKFLSVYEAFYENIKDKNWIEQMYLSLDRFSEFTSLPPDFIAQLYPFNISKKYYHDGYSGNVIKTNNPLLEDFFRKYITVDSGKTTYKRAENISLEEYDDLQTKLDELIDKLNLSQIYHVEVQKEENKYKKEYIEIKKNRDKEKECECFNCLFWKLKLDQLATVVEAYEIKDTTDLKEDLKFAFGLTRIGQFVKARDAYKSIATKAWQQEKKMLHLFAKRNEKFIRNPIEIELYADKKEKNDEYVSNIKQELSAIDFEKIIRNFKGLDNKQLQLIRSTIEENVERKAKDEIRDLYEKIKVKRKSEDNGSNQQAEFSKLLVELVILHNFYFHNCLVQDIFTNHTDIYNDAFKALLFRYSKNEEYTGSLKAFESFSLITFIHYGNAASIRQTLKDLDLKKLPVTENANERAVIFKVINNFFTSIIDNNNSTGIVSGNESLLKYTGNNHLSGKIQRWFENILLLLTYIELKEDEATEVFQHLIYFLKYENSQNWSNIEYLSRFLYKHKNFVTIHHINDLLQIALDKPQDYITHFSEFSESISAIYREKKFEELPNQQIINQLVDQFIFDDNDRDVVLYLHSLADLNTKQKIKNQVHHVLTTKYDRNTSAIATNLNIVDFKDYEDVYLNSLSKEEFKVKIGVHYFADNQLIYKFMKFAYSYYFHQIPISKIEERSIEIYEDYQHFYLYPDSFDMNKFDLEWLTYNDWHPQVIFNALLESKIGEQIKEQLLKHLKKENNPKLGEIYFKYFS